MNNWGLIFSGYVMYWRKKICNFFWLASNANSIVLKSALIVKNWTSSLNKIEVEIAQYFLYFLWSVYTYNRALYSNKGKFMFCFRVFFFFYDKMKQMADVYFFSLSFLFCGRVSNLFNLEKKTNMWL